LTEQVDLKKRQSIKNAIAIALGLASGTVGGMISAGSSAPSEEFVRRKPTSRTVTSMEANVDTEENRLLDMKNHNDNPINLSKQWIALLRRKSDGKAFWALNDSGMLAQNYALVSDAFDPDLDQAVNSAGFVGGINSVDFAGSIAVGLGSGLDDGSNSSSWDWLRGAYFPSPSTEQNGTQRNARLSTEAFDAFSIDTVGRTVFIDTTQSDRLSWREHTTPSNKRACLYVNDPTLLRQSLGGMWTRQNTFTNIGTAYIDVYALGVGLPVRMDFLNKTQVAAKIQWNKIGTGTQNLRAVDADNVANVLFTSASLVTGDNNVALTAFPAAFNNTNKRIKLQAKSTTAGDDPVFEGCSITLI